MACRGRPYQVLFATLKAYHSRKKAAQRRDSVYFSYPAGRKQPVKTNIVFRFWKERKLDVPQGSASGLSFLTHVPTILSFRKLKLKYLNVQWYGYCFHQKLMKTILKLHEIKQKEMQIVCILSERNWSYCVRLDVYAWRKEKSWEPFWCHGPTTIQRYRCFMTDV